MLRILNNMKYELVIFLILCFQVFGRMPAPHMMDRYCTSSYLVSYDAGFITRAFIGTIVNFLTGDYITKEFVWLFILASLLLLCLLTACLLGRLIEAADGNNSFFVICMVALYLASPVSPAYLAEQQNFGRMDIYLALFTFLILFFVKHPFLRWFIPALLFCMLATHMACIFFYIPLLLIILCHNAFREKNLSSKILLAISAIVTTVGSAYFILFSAAQFKYKTVQDFAESSGIQTNLGWDYGIIRVEYFYSLSDHYAYARGAFLNNTFSAFHLIFLIPMLIVLIYFWKKSISNEKERIQHLIYLSAISLPLVSIPAFILFVDWGRWIAFLLTSQFILIFWFIYHKEKAAQNASHIIGEKAGKNLFMVLLIIIYMSSLGRYTHSLPNSLDRIRVNFHQLTNIQMDISSYFDSFNNPNYAIVMAANGDISRPDNKVADKLVSLGFMDLRQIGNAAYAAVKNNGEVKHDSSPTPFQGQTNIDGVTIYFISSPVLEPSGKMMAENQIYFEHSYPGLNILVYDKTQKKVVDAVTLDIGHGANMLYR